MTTPAPFDENPLPAGMTDAEMCRVTTDQVIDEWVADKRQFTLYDITKEVRSRLGRGVSVPHYGADGVHDTAIDLLNDKIGDPALGWNRVLVEPKGLKPGQPKPQLYYHESTDPRDYEQVATPTVTVTLVRPDGLPAPTPPTGTARVLVPAPKDRRLCIPRALMQSKGLQPGEQVVVLADKSHNCLIIAKDDPTTIVDNRAAGYTVDLRGTIRVSKTVLDEVGLTGDEFQVTEDPTLGLVVTKNS